MKLIGIYIYEETPVSLRKSVKPKWYPFVQSEAPDSNYISFPKYTSAPSSFYKINDDLPVINISAIVGMNGAGKSTLINILLLVLNNLAISIFSGHDEIIVDEWPERKVITFVKGIYADLLYEQDGKNYCVRCRGKSIGLYEHNGKQDFREIQIHDLNTSQMAETLSNFLSYTIALNFGIYDFNSEDTLDFEQKAKNVHHDIWMDNYFHRVDGYFIPMTIIPSRNQGVINVNREAEFARQRIAAIDLLLYSKEMDCIISAYRPKKIKYKIKWMIDDTAKKTASRIMKFSDDQKNNEKIVDELFSMLKHLWEEAVNIPDYQESRLTSTIKNYLVVETLNICANYPQFSIEFDVVSNSFSRTVLADTIEKIMNDKSHVSDRIQDTLAFINNDEYKDIAGEVEVDHLIKKSDTFITIKRKLPPPFFFYELIYSHVDSPDESIRFWNFSSGEKQLLFVLSSVIYHLVNLASISTDDENRVGYRHLNLIFDEIELYFHPEFQRVLIQKILEVLSAINFVYSQIESINILLATHSPYILSDIPATNILFMTDDTECKQSKTLAANIYDLLRDGFFMKSGIGEFSSNMIRRIINLSNDNIPQNANDSKWKDSDRRDAFKFFVENVGDPYFYDILSKEINRIDSTYMTTDEIDEEIIKIDRRREQLIRLRNEKG